MQTDVRFDANVKDGRAAKGLLVLKSSWASTIDEPPFETYSATCGVTFTFGGVRVNTRAQDIDTEGEPINTSTPPARY